MRREDAAQSIERVYRDSSGSLKRFLTRFLDSPVEIEDVLQEAFVKTLEAARKTHIAAPRAFIFTTCKNLALNVIARNRCHRTDAVADFDELAVLYDIEAISALDPEAELVLDQLLGFAREAVEGMTPRVQEVFVLRKIYGFTHKEIGARLGIAVSTVEKHIARGVLHVKRHAGSGEFDLAGTGTGR